VECDNDFSKYGYERFQFSWWWLWRFLWDVTLCSLIDLCWYFGGTSCLFFQDRRVSLFCVFQILVHYNCRWQWDWDFLTICRSTADCCRLQGVPAPRGSIINGDSGNIFLIKGILLEVDASRIWIIFYADDVLLQGRTEYKNSAI
jgi:hypothetical protein